MIFRATEFVFLSAIFAAGASAEGDGILQRVPRQSHGKNGQQDQSSAETGFLGGGGVENSKYFQDIYVLRPDPMEIEFGHVFENPREWVQRYEKKDFNKNRHQGKVRTDCLTNRCFYRGMTQAKPAFDFYKPQQGLFYQHLPEHDKYEFGHRRGNEHHVIERYEKAIPHEGQFKTKVRWADKKGGHGEHYWDYNHAGHGGNGGHNDGDKNGGYSDQVPVYSPLHKSSKNHQKRQLESEKKITLDDVDVESSSTTGTKSSVEKEIFGAEKYDIQKETVKPKRNSAERSFTDDSHLFIDLKSGEVVDELTGKKYILQPVN